MLYYNTYKQEIPMDIFNDIDFASKCFKKIDLQFESVFVNQIKYCLNDKSRKGRAIIKFFSKIKNNKILKKINPWFKHKFLFYSAINKFFQDDFIKNYKNVWRGSIVSHCNTVKKENYNVDEFGFRKYLLEKEKKWMSKFSVNYCLNKDNKHFS
jgi:hypothetical protein